MKTIGFELSKKLNDLGLLDNIETEYYISEIGNNILYSNKEIKDLRENFNAGYVGMFKTLTLEETIEFLPDSIRFPGGVPQGLTIHKYDDENKKYSVVYDFLGRKTHHFCGQTLLEAIEKMLERLMDNGLLNKNK